MNESITISRRKPELKSMQYDFLRQEGIRHIQKLAGKIWTDYNVHDPGITIHEVLCYAITDLGYRSSFDIKDLLAPAPGEDPDIRNFHPARKILHNRPVTLLDYRKLMMDVTVPVEGTEEFVGIKNAWIEVSGRSELPVYVYQRLSKLSYSKAELHDILEEEDQDPLDIKILYNVLLEFDKSESLGDLNESIIEGDYVISGEELMDPNLQGLSMNVKVKFPGWDHPEVDWDSLYSIKTQVVELDLTFFDLPDDYHLDYYLKEDKDLVLEGKKGKFADEDIPDLEALNDAINDKIYGPVESLIIDYQKRVRLVFEILEKVKATLHANRNLGEDFLEFNALKVEEILLCADVEIANDAGVEETQAAIFHEVSKFLSPAVNFYSLEEMLTKCLADKKFTIESIDQAGRIFTVPYDLTNIVLEGDILTLSGFGENDGEYSVKSVSLNKVNEEYTDLVVEESIPSKVLVEDGILFLGRPAESSCMPVEKIFEGPALQNGFIDNEELLMADRRNKIHTSDLVQLIMDVPGVIAVKNLQIANIPQDNEEGDIGSRSVRWCLELAVDQNYVPRLNMDRSRLTFYKGQLPFKANQQEVEEMVSILEEAERPPRLTNPTVDFSIPMGEYRDLEDYTSIQEELPLIYGTSEYSNLSSEVLNGNEDAKLKARIKQLKGFLTIFDQLLANYLSQLAHVKDLFSFNPQKKGPAEEYDFVVDKTYYSQPLLDTVPYASLLFNESDEDAYKNWLQGITEEKETFIRRRNKFLDHLLARFSESFTDYALLNIQVAGESKEEELIEDKQDFLTRYPELSADRGKAFDYKNGEEIWHVDNLSGFENRVTFLAGIDPKENSYLAFTEKFRLKENSGKFSFEVKNGSKILLSGTLDYPSEEQAMLAIEKTIIAGTLFHNYQVVEEEGAWFFKLISNGRAIAVSKQTNYPDETAARAEVDETIEILSTEFFERPKSNRNNLSMPFDCFFKYTVKTKMSADPPEFQINYTLYTQPYNYQSQNKLLSGSYKDNGEAKIRVEITDVDAVGKTFTVDANLTAILTPGDKVYLTRFAEDPGIYTVQSMIDEFSKTRLTVDEAIALIDQTATELRYTIVEEEALKEYAYSIADQVLWEVVDFGRNESWYDHEQGELYNRKGDLIATLANEVAVEEAVKFIYLHFFNQEGIHLVEHVLLRPKINQFIEADEDTLEADYAGSVYIPFRKSIQVLASGTESGNHFLVVKGHVKAELQFNRRVRVTNEPQGDLDEIFTIGSMKLDGANTKIYIIEKIEASATEVSRANLLYVKKITVSAVDPVAKTLTVPGTEETNALTKDSEIRIINLRNDEERAVFILGKISKSSGSVTMAIARVNVHDRLLPIYLDTAQDLLTDCDACKLDNPYSYILQVVLPAWPGRFTNPDFRKFFERTLRSEAPAHLFLNICWVSYSQMEEFEKKYKAWLLTKQKEEIPEGASLEERLATLDDLIDILERLRNVHPVKTLHDCETSDSTDDAIILGQTALGEL